MMRKLIALGAAAGALLCLALTTSPELKIKLGGENRTGVSLSTDKQIYRTGEKIYFRVVALDAFQAFPIRGTQYAVLKIKGPRGELVRTLNSVVNDSTGGLMFPIPAELPGGVYRAFCSVNGSAEAERGFEIRAYRVPRLNTQIEFLKDAYGAGELVRAVLNVRRAEGGVPDNARIQLTARIGNREIVRIPNLKMDARGNVSAEFRLPSALDSADGVVAFQIRDGGVVETAAKSLPLIGNGMEFEFYPESGDLVAGTPSRVYFEARLKNGKPAAVSGSIVTKSGKTIAKAESVHEGRGVFELTPEKGEAYWFRVNAPMGIAEQYPLPEVKSGGIVLRSEQAVFAYRERICLRIAGSGDSFPVRVVLTRREREIASAEVKENGVVNLDAGEYEGVLIATVYDRNNRPLAERLIFRSPNYRTKIEMKASGSFVPGGRVKLNIRTTDCSGNPVEGIVGVCVTDESVFAMIDRREQAPSLPVMVYLENDVKELADAQIYLDHENPKSAAALDLLLGTQGWRRFIVADFDSILKQYENPAKRALAWMAPPRPHVLPAARFNRNVKFKSAIPIVAEAAPDRVQENAIVPVVKMEAASPMPPAWMDVAKQRVYKPVSVREYAHAKRPNRIPNDRSDFTETIYWNAGLRTNPRTGEASVEFDLPDSITSFRVNADAFGNNGALGAQSITIRSAEPFYVEAKLPQQITLGDTVRIPLSLANGTDQTLENIALTVAVNGKNLPRNFSLKHLNAGERGRIDVAVTPDRLGVCELVFHAAAGGYTDKVTRSIRVIPSGFPVEFHAGGVLNPDSSYVCTVKIPQDAEPGSVKTSVKIYSSPLAGMEEALNALLRQPYGCFEQTSSTTYPLVMAQQYFLSHSGIAPEKIREAADLLKNGYRKLTGFESKNRGYEWFGGDPGHEALTAYGLMQFHEMKNVMAVDSTMLERTSKWLLSRRDGKGGFLRNERALDSFGRAPAPTTNAYILWTLLESGTDVPTLRREIDSVGASALVSDDSYIHALAANILHLAGDRKSASVLASRLAAKQQTDGSVDGGKMTITRSGGDSLKIETTSLAVLAWLRIDGKFLPQTERAMKWLFERCKSGRFGSTQSTILALKAINAYDKMRSVPKRAGSVRLVIDGKEFGHPVSFDKDTKEALFLPDFAAAMSPGEHRIALKMMDGSQMPFSIEVSCSTKLPASSPKCGVTVSTELIAGKVKEGELTELNVTVRSGAQDVSMPLAVIGIPGGFEVRHEQLKELVKEGRISAYEIFRGNLVLYWRALRAKDSVQIPVSLKAAVPGVYTAPASSVWLYYTEELKDWTRGVSCEIL